MAAPKRTPPKRTPRVPARARKLNDTQMGKHLAMVERKKDQALLMAEVQEIEAQWNRYSLQLAKDLKLKPDETLTEAGEIVQTQPEN